MYIYFYIYFKECKFNDENWKRVFCVLTRWTREKRISIRLLFPSWRHQHQQSLSAPQPLHRQLPGMRLSVWLAICFLLASCRFLDVRESIKKTGNMESEFDHTLAKREIVMVTSQQEGEINVNIVFLFYVLNYCSWNSSCKCQKEIMVLKCKCLNNLFSINVSLLVVI